MFVHPKLLRAARLSLDISQDDVAAAAGISRRSLQKLELCNPDTTVRTIEAVQRALVGYGVVFLIEDQNAGWGFRLPRGHLQKIEKAG
jgi:transcriptional regulator with XRE-family HTH domain